MRRRFVRVRETYALARGPWKISCLSASSIASSPEKLSTSPQRRRRRRRQPECDGGPLNEALVATFPGGWSDVREEIKRHAESLGFARARVTTPEPSSRFAQYKAWIEEGKHGEMGYLAREDRLARRADLDLILPGLQAVICTMTLYWPGKKGFPPASSMHAAPSSTTLGPSPVRPGHTASKKRGVISCYSWGEDYHNIITPRLQALAEWMHTRYGGRGRWYVDTGPIMERDLGERAGLGFVGKNTLLINEHLGSGTFLAELLTTLPLPPETPRKKSGGCGKCRRCISACPTQAIHKDGYSIDARRCISYLTIENKGSIPIELRPSMKNLVYGCDICQQVCPWNRWSWPDNQPKTLFSPSATSSPSTPPFLPPSASSLELSTPVLVDLLRALKSDAGFMKWFTGSPITRIGRARMLRNVAVAAGNSGGGGGREGEEGEDGEELLAVLKDVWEEENDGMVKEHLSWAIQRLEGEVESEEAVREVGR